MQHVVFVSATQGYSLLTIKEKIESGGIRVTVVPPEMKELSAIKDKGERIDACLIYAEEEIISKTSSLVFIRDHAAEHDVPVFIAGSAEAVESVRGVMPDVILQGIFTRPLNVTDIAEKISEYVTSHTGANKKKILVVDDSGAMLRSIKGWLDDKYQVALVNSGTMAIKYLANNRPDLILLDYEMPVLDGSKLLEMIRSESDFSSIPVIFLTSKGDRESVMKVMSLKVDGYLLKTMHPSEIIKAIDDFFEKQKLKALSKVTQSL